MIYNDYLVVGGGGSGGASSGGGGGAGGVRSSFPGGTKVKLFAGVNNILVGAGGAPNPIGPNCSMSGGFVGNMSTVGVINSAGGGRGGACLVLCVCVCACRALVWCGAPMWFARVWWCPWCVGVVATC